MDIYASLTTYTVEVTGRRSTAAVIEDASGTGTVRVRATSKRAAVEQVLRRAADGITVLLGGERVFFDQVAFAAVRKNKR